MNKITFLFLYIVSQSLGYCDNIFTNIHKNFYKAYRNYWCQDVELDYKVKMYLNEIISLPHFHYEDCEDIDVYALCEDSNYAAFNKLYFDSNYEKRICLFYKFYLYEFLPKNKNILYCFRGLLNWFIKEKEKRDGARPDILHLNLLYNEQNKINAALKTL